MIPKQSIFTENTRKAVGIIIKIQEKENQTIYEIKTRENLIAYFKEKNHYNLGDKVKITGIWAIPNKNTSKGLFNYQDYLKRKNIYYTVQVDSIMLVKKNGNAYYFIKQIIQKSFRQNAYLHTLLLGDKSYIREEVLRSYQENGISHLFAISGMHITLLSSILNKIIRKWKREETTYQIISIILVCYLLLVGVSPSILRGVLFYILFEGNKIYYFYIKKENLFLLVLSISLLMNPYNILDVGFEYSFLISYALLKQSEKLTSENKILSLLKVSFTSFFASIPITIKNFNQLNFLSILYNLFYVPYVSSIIFPLTLIVSIMKPLEPIYNFFIIVLEESSIFLSKISVLKLVWQDLPIIIYIGYFILIIFYLNTNKKQILFLYLVLLLIHFLLPYINQKDFLKMIDVGQGDSILLLSNHKSVLVDTGGKISYGKKEDGKIFYNTIYPVLKKEGIKNLDYLIITHGDKDHIGEATTLLNTIKVKKIIMNCNQENFWEKEIVHKNKIIGYEGLSFKAGDFYFTQLNECMENENDSSQIYYVTYKDKRILLTGDASIKSEKTMLEKYDVGKLDILKVGHHGSTTSTSSKLIEKTNPTIALISSGKNNKFHHPHEEIIKRLEKNNTMIYNTQKEGTITLYLNQWTIRKDTDGL